MQTKYLKTLKPAPASSTWYVVATQDADLKDKARAHVILPATNTAAAFQACFTAAHPRVELVGRTLQLDDDVDVVGVDNVHLYSSTRCTVITKTRNDPTVYTSTKSAFKIRGVTTTIVARAAISGTVAKGAKSIPTGAVNLTSVLFPGSYIHLQSNTARNVNRALQNCKGEHCRVVSVTASQINLERGLRETYNLAACTIKRADMVQRPTVENVAFAMNPGSTNRQALCVVEYAVQPKVTRVRCTGNEASKGIEIVECLDALVEAPEVEDIADSLNTSSWTGYGVYIVGGHGGAVMNLRAQRCRHAIDFGTRGSYEHSVPRDWNVIEGCASACYSAAYSTHDSEYVTFQSCTSIWCGGGFVGRGTHTHFLDCRIIGTHSETPSIYSQGQSYLHAFTIGEPDDPYVNAAAGRGGEGLVIIDPVVDFQGCTPGASAVYCYDPLLEAHIVAKANPLSVLRSGVLVLGDYVKDSTIDISVDGTLQYNPLSGDTYAFCFKPPAASTVPQYMINSTVRVSCRTLRGSAVFIGGGRNGGVSEGNNISVKVSSLNTAQGASAATPQLVFDTNAYGRNDIQLDCPLTAAATAVTNLPADTVWPATVSSSSGAYPPVTPNGDLQYRIASSDSASQFIPGQTGGVPDTATLTVDAGVSQRLTLPTGTAFKIDFSGYGPFAVRFGDSTVSALATDFPGVVGQPLIYQKPAGATHLAVYGIGAGAVTVSGGAFQVNRGVLKYDMPVLRRKFAGVLANNADCILGVVGDSHNAAAAAGTGTGFKWVGAFRYAPVHMLARLLDASGYPCSYDNYMGQRGEIVGLPTFDPLWTMANGTWTYNNGGNKALGNNIMRCTAAPLAPTTPATATRTTEKPWDVCDVWINAGANCLGVIALSATGAPTVNYDFSNKTAAFTKLTVTKSAVDMNPLVISCTTPISLVTGFDAPGIAAVDFKNSKQATIRVHNHAIGGASMGSHIATNAPGSNFLAYQAIGMDVLIIESFINEIRGGIPMATWLANWTTFLNIFDTAARDIIVYIGFPANPAIETWVNTQDTWISALRDLLDARGINLIDARTIYGATYAQALADGLIHDDYHPNKIGLGMKAQAIKSQFMSVLNTPQGGA